MTCTDGRVLDVKDSSVAGLVSLFYPGAAVLSPSGLLKLKAQPCIHGSAFHEAFVSFGSLDRLQLQRVGHF